MKVNWKDHIVSTPDMIRGKPCIKGTRIPASLILGYFAAGNTIKKIIAEFPDLDKVHIAGICVKSTIFTPPLAPLKGGINRKTPLYSPFEGG
jgi:uncharacterized protein (DUF433 family)